MKRLNLFFSHGKESGPWGGKIRALADVAEKLGISVSSIDYTSQQDPEKRVQMLLEASKNSPRETTIFAGSSMGGYVSAAAAEQFSPKGLFLMAPALFIPGYPRTSFNINCPNICVVHGWDDQLIPPANPMAFAKAHKADLHLLNAGHRLKEVRPQLESLFEQFLRRALA